MLVNFDRFFIQEDNYVTEKIREIAEESKSQFPEFEASFTVTGRYPIRVTAQTTNNANRYFYQTVGYGMIAIVSIILFRGLAAFFVVALAPSLGVFWTLGFI